jgi:hypothetical protein
MRKLNMWHRLGIVASVLWCVGAAIWQRQSDIASARAMSGLGYRLCTEAAASKGNYDFSSCEQKFSQAYQLYLGGSWGNVAIVAIVPVIFGWFVAYLLVWIARWILAGRARNP